MMDDVCAVPVRWTRLRWGTLILLVFAIQIALVFVGTRLGNGRARQTEATVTHFLLRAPGQPLPLEARLEDPTLFSLPNSNGFSGRIWAPEPIGHVLPAWQEEPRFKVPAISEMGVSFIEYVRTNTVSALRIEDRREPVLTQLDLEESSVIEESRMSIEGPLKDRELIWAPEAPVIPTSERLAETVVEVMVDRLGRVRTARPLLPGTSRSPGQETADAQGEELAGKLMFRPLPPVVPPAPRPPDSGTWGRIVWKWKSMPPEPPPSKP